MVDLSSPSDANHQHGFAAMWPQGGEMVQGVQRVRGETRADSCLVGESSRAIYLAPILHHGPE